MGPQGGKSAADELFKPDLSKISDDDLMTIAQSASKKELVKEIRGRKVKRDGGILRCKEEICKDYDSSNMPYPFKNIIKLDYCWRLNYTLWKQSIYVTAPASIMWFMYRDLDKFWSYSLKTFPFRRLAYTFVGVTIGMNIFNTVYSLAFEDYCKRNSKIYDTRKRNAKAIRALIRETNEENKKTVSGKGRTTLSDQEILDSK